MALAGPDTGAPLLLEVERFEHVSATNQRVLLRLDGRYVERRGRRVLEAALIVDDGLAVHRHAPLAERGGSDAAAESWLWRAAFAVPSSYLTDARTRFALEAEPGHVLDLPQPRVARFVVRPPARGSRVSRTARKYAVAVAAIVTVAVAPGGLPANARPQVIKVRRPDGSIVFVTSDGSPIGAPGASPGGGSMPQTGATAATPQGGTAGATPQTGAAGATPQTGAAGATPQIATASPSPPAGAPAPHASAPDANRVSTPPAPRRSAPHDAQPSAHDHQVPASARMPAPSARQPAAPASDTPHATTAPPSHSSAPSQAITSSAAATAAPARVAPPLDPPSTFTAGGAPAPSPGVPEPSLEPVFTLAPALSPLPALDGASAQSDTQTPAPELPAVDRAAPPLTPLEQHAPSTARRGSQQRQSGDRAPARPPAPHRDVEPERPAAHPPASTSAPSAPPSTPAPSAPAPGPSLPAPSTAATPFGSLPGPSSTTTIPSFLIDRFQIPPFLLPIYQAAAVEYGIRWEVLAAINEIETDYGRDLSVSSAGALGWMQFMPDTWKTYGVDANRDGKRDPYNPVDAIFAAARYLKAAGGDKDIRGAVFSYNHASWYVDSVMLRAQLIASYPPELVSALTGLTEGRFPIAAPSRYAGALTTAKRGGSAAPSLPAPADPANGIDIYTQPGAPVVAVGDGVVKRMGRSKVKGLYVVLQDVYGNEYTYSGLGSLAQVYPVPKIDVAAVAAADTAAAHDPSPRNAATAGQQTPGTSPAPSPSGGAQTPIAGVKQRLFAHPLRPNARSAGGLDQVLAANQAAGGFETYDAYFARPLGLNSRNATLRPLRAGASVVASTVLGRAGGPGADGQARVHFEVRPAGKGAPDIDPRPLLDGWRLLETSDVYGPSGHDALTGGTLTIGEMMLLPKPLLEQRVLSDPRIKIYAGGRSDIRTGQIDRRVLEVLEYLADSGLKPTVSCLKSGHSEFTTSGNVSEHASGNAVDIAAINGTPILGHQGHGDIAEKAVRRLMMLQGTLQPHQIISLLALGGNTLALPDHANHIHVGFRPLFGDNTKLGEQAMAVLKPDQWSALAKRLGEIGNPVVSLTPSKYALPDH